MSRFIVALALALALAVVGTAAHLASDITASAAVAEPLRWLRLLTSARFQKEANVTRPIVLLALAFAGIAAFTVAFGVIAHANKSDPGAVHGAVFAPIGARLPPG